MFEYAFMQRAFAAAILVGAVSGALGFFVVLRRLAFIGVGISHSAIGGVALGLVLGWNPLATGAGFAVAVALGIAALERRGDVSRDAAIGVFFSGSMALAVVLFSLQSGYRQDLFGYLFGSVLAISPGELAALAGAAGVLLASLALIFRPLLFASFDEEIARAYGHRVDALNAALLVLLATGVIIGVRLVGVLLIEALLVVPATVAALWTPDYRRQVAAAIVLGAGCGAAGLTLAWQLDLAAGGTIVLLAIAVFVLSLVARRTAG